MSVDWDFDAAKVAISVSYIISKQSINQINEVSNMPEIYLEM